MAVRRAHVVVPQIGVRIDLQHGQSRMLLGHGCDDWTGDGVLAAEEHRELVAADDLEAIRRISDVTSSSDANGNSISGSV
jgi:hypothetical protein